MFITFEGIEGSGKTTQIRHLAQYLQRRGRECVTTREPGGTRIGRGIRALLLNPENQEMAPEVEMLLYTADRLQHAVEIIRPALARGKTVLCDRFFDATMAYQGVARQLDMDLILQLHRLMIDNLTPDVTLLFDLPAEIGLTRAWQRIDQHQEASESRFEAEALAFHQRVREGYLELARQHPRRYRIIDARPAQDRVRNAVIAAVTPLLSSDQSL